jgi:hypothetical protein
MPANPLNDFVRRCQRDAIAPQRLPTTCRLNSLDNFMALGASFPPSRRPCSGVEENEQHEGGEKGEASPKTMKDAMSPHLLLNPRGEGRTNQPDEKQQSEKERNV